MKEKRCILCNCVDKTGLINNMCTDCYCLSLDIGKTKNEKQEKEWKKELVKLENRRSENNYYTIVNKEYIEKTKEEN